MKDEIKDINERWSEIKVIIDERKKKLKKEIELIKKFRDEMEGLK